MIVAEWLHWWEHMEAINELKTTQISRYSYTYTWFYCIHMYKSMITQPNRIDYVTDDYELEINHFATIFSNLRFYIIITFCSVSQYYLFDHHADKASVNWNDSRVIALGVHYSIKCHYCESHPFLFTCCCFLLLSFPNLRDKQFNPALPALAH